MDRSLRLDELVSASGNRYVLIDNLLLWRCADRRLAGLSVTKNDHPARELRANALHDALRALCSSAEDEVFVLDLAQLSAANAELVIALLRALTERAHNAQLVLVKPTGFAGELVESACAILRAQTIVRSFVDLQSLIDALQIGCELAALLRQTRSDPMLVRLRALITQHAGKVALPQAARLMGVSERTLQRRLLEANTSFNSERRQARLAEAERLMLTTRLDLTAVAIECGFSSAAHFSTSFRLSRGESPRGWLLKRMQSNSALAEG